VPSHGVTIDRLREMVARGQFAVSAHAVQELRKDGLGLRDGVDAILSGAIAEDYEERCCCLVSGPTSDGFYLHVVVDYRREERVVIVTAYVPESQGWVLPRALRRR